MACGGCGKKRVVVNSNPDDIMGGFGHLTDRQIKARLDRYKKKYCNECIKRYDCNYEIYVACKKSEKK